MMIKDKTVIDCFIEAFKEIEPEIDKLIEALTELEEDDEQKRRNHESRRT